MSFIGNCRPLCIGSLPHLDAGEAWEEILKHFPKTPFWPQLPMRSYLENMYIQFSEHLPGQQLNIEKQQFHIDRSQDLQQEMEEFYNNYMSTALEPFKISRDYCEGIYYALDMLKNDETIFSGLDLIKGQVTGPVSFGLQLVDESKTPILYDEMLHDILVKNLERTAQWQEHMLRKIHHNTIISVDEPYLSSIGSGVINLNPETVVSDINSIFNSLSGIKATHCCANTDWSLLMRSSTDIILFDAFGYMKNLALFSSELGEFFGRGGCIGWGIVPSTAQELEKCKLETVLEHFNSGLKLLLDKGLDKNVILRQSVITPSCGLGNLSIPQAKYAMNLTKELSEQLRTKYDLA
jgi:hypothetical protein